ncbi:MAG: 2Fe-2S iron-sulfur cluster-binding protein [Terriglobales bacterium]
MALFFFCMPECDPFHRVTLITPEGELSLRVGEGQHIWDAAAEAGIKLPAICHQGRCLTCAGRLKGPGEVDQSDSNSYFPADREAGFVLLCTGKPRSDLRIVTHQADAMRKHRRELKLPAPYS